MSDKVKKVMTDRVLLKPVEEDDKTKGGLLKPKQSAKEAQRGTVVAVGEGKYIGDSLIPVSVEVGDEVLYEDYAGKDVYIGEENYVVVREQEIILVLEQ